MSNVSDVSDMSDVSNMSDVSDMSDVSNVSNMSNMPNMTNNERDETDYPPDAPPILDLEDEEKFHDNEGNAVEIETRGERTSKCVLFLTKDVAIVFNMPHLVKALTKEDRGYEKEHHYQFYATLFHYFFNTRPLQL